MTILSSKRHTRFCCGSLIWPGIWDLSGRNYQNLWDNIGNAKKFCALNVAYFCAECAYFLPWTINCPVSLRNIYDLHRCTRFLPITSCTLLSEVGHPVCSRQLVIFVTNEVNSIMAHRSLKWFFQLQRNSTPCEGKSYLSSGELCPWHRNPKNGFVDFIAVFL